MRKALIFIVWLIASTGLSQNEKPSQPILKESLEGRGKASQNVTVEELKRIQSKMQANEHLAVTFVQKQFKPLRKRTYETKGQAYFSRPTKFRWIYEQDDKGEWLFDGETLHRYWPAKKAATKMPMGGDQAAQLRQIVDIVLNSDRLFEQYEVQDAQRQGQLIKTTLVPKVKSDLAEVTIHISTKDNTVELLKLGFSDGGSNTLYFSDPKTAIISADTYKVPKGVKVSAGS